MISEVVLTILYIGKSRETSSLISSLTDECNYSFNIEKAADYENAIDRFNELHTEQSKILCVFDLQQPESESLIVQYINSEFSNSTSIILFNQTPWVNSLDLLTSHSIYGMIPSTDHQQFQRVLLSALNDMARLETLEIQHANFQQTIKELKIELSDRTTELLKNNLTLKTLSTTDKLTQLPNRLKIDEQFNFNLETSKRYRTSFSIILLDIDHFKNVNDTFGHQTGDIILKKIADTLKTNIRQTDLVGRWGGEEFLILCSNSNLEETMQLAEKLRLIISQLNFDEVGQVTSSFGVTSYKDNDTESTIISRTDEALYQAKEKGRNIVIAS
jgi:diguanylate cyclase (GGDEF)-like protein